MSMIEQIREFDASTNAMMSVVAISSDPTLYRRKVEARDAILNARRQQRRQVRGAKTSFLNG